MDQLYGTGKEPEFCFQHFEPEHHLYKCKWQKKVHKGKNTAKKSIHRNTIFLSFHKYILVFVNKKYFDFEYINMDNTY